MTYEALQHTIAKLLIARSEADGNEAEQNRISIKLNKLYELKYTMLEQMAKQEELK